MPVIKFVKEKKEIEVPSGTNLRHAALSAGINLYQGLNGFGAGLNKYLNCHGLGMCGMCRVLVTKGMEHTSPAGAMERLRFRCPVPDPLPCLAFVGHEDTMRLACKTTVHGDMNTKYLTENGVSIWNEWADADGNLGPVYGKQWRSWQAPDGRTIDQMQGVVEQIKRNPDSRRLIVSAWNPADVPQMALPPCHLLFQFYVAEGRLSCQLYQRSADVFLGVPFNIASYALLTMMVAQATDLQPGDFVHTLGDAHLYDNHLEQARLQLTREPRPLPTMRLNPAVKDLFAFQFEDFQLEAYDPHPHIKAPVAI